MVAMMQMLSAMIVEGINMAVLIGQNSTYACILNFVSMLVISQIDDIYISSLSEGTFDRIQDSENWQPKIVYPQVEWVNRSSGNKLLFMFYRVVRGYYISFYFYFFPFLSLVFSYLATRCTDI